jgi:uncharacterized protein YqgC (DUF456 family)
MSVSQLQFVAYALMTLGLIGAVVPVLPGAILIFAGALLWGIADQFVHIGAPTLITLGVITALTMVSDFLLSTMNARKVGATWKTIAGAVIGGMLGGLISSVPVPLFGTVIGAGIGAAIGVTLVELWLRKDLRTALRTAQRYCLGSLTSVAINLALCLLMLLIFAWQAGII